MENAIGALLETPDRKPSSPFVRVPLKPGYITPFKEF